MAPQSDIELKHARRTLQMQGAQVRVTINGPPVQQIETYAIEPHLELPEPQKADTARVDWVYRCELLFDVVWWQLQLNDTIEFLNGQYQDTIWIVSDIPLDTVRPPLTSVVVTLQ